MEISELSIRIILLFLPGIISRLIIENLTTYTEKGIFYFTMYTLLLGFFSYFSYIVVLKVINLMPYFNVQENFYFLKALTDSKQAIDISEVFWVSICSVFIGLFLSLIINRQYFQRVAQKLTITKKFDEIDTIDVWEYLWNSSDNTQWVTVRDIKYNLAYEGWVEVFSDTFIENELFIRDVIVFNNTTGEKLYEVPALYITRNQDEITIEFTGIEFTDLIKRSSSKTNEGDSENER